MIADPFHGRSDSFDQLPWFSDPLLNEWICRVLAAYGFTICDVGAGTGLMVSHYDAHFRVGTLVEPSESMRALLQERVGADSDFRVCAGTAEDLPLSDNECEVVLSKNALHHATDVDVAIQEMARVASSVIAIAEVTLPDEAARSYLEQLLPRKEHGRSTHTIWSPKQLGELMRPHCRKVHLLHHDQFIDLDLWLDSSPLAKNERDELKAMVRSQPNEVADAMLLHERHGRLTQLRRITLAVGFV